MIALATVGACVGSQTHIQGQFISFTLSGRYSAVKRVEEIQFCAGPSHQFFL